MWWLKANNYQAFIFLWYRHLSRTECWEIFLVFLMMVGGGAKGTSIGLKIPWRFCMFLIIWDLKKKLQNLFSRVFVSAPRVPCLGRSLSPMQTRMVVHPAEVSPSQTALRMIARKSKWNFISSFSYLTCLCFWLSTSLESYLALVLLHLFLGGSVAQWLTSPVESDCGNLNLAALFTGFVTSSRDFSVIFLHL